MDTSVKPLSRMVHHRLLAFCPMKGYRSIGCSVTTMVPLSMRMKVTPGSGHTVAQM